MQTTKRKCIKFALIVFYIMVLISKLHKKLTAPTDLSLSHGRSFVANNSVAENVRSTLTDVSGMVNKALNNLSNLLGLFPVASSSFISSLITV